MRPFEREPNLWKCHKLPWRVWILLWVKLTCQAEFTVNFSIVLERREGVNVMMPCWERPLCERKKYICEILKYLKSSESEHWSPEREFMWHADLSALMRSSLLYWWLNSRSLVFVLTGVLWHCLSEYLFAYQALTDRSKDQCILNLLTWYICYRLCHFEYREEASEQDCETDLQPKYEFCL